MKAPSCSICKQTVLELAGQYEVLQGYYAESDCDHPAITIAGWCHSPCLAESEYRTKWHEWQLKHFTTTRGYERVGEADGWTVLQLTRLRELFGLCMDGTTVDAKRKAGGPAGTKCQGGLCIPVDEEYNLELEDETIIREIKDRLQRDGAYPIIELYQALGIQDKIRWPQALVNGAFRLNKKLTRSSGRFAVSMRAVYHSFLPEALIPFWRQLGRPQVG